MSAPLTRTTTCQVFRRRLGGTRDFGPVLLPRPAPRGRMLLFRSAPEITNGRTGCCGTKVDATLFGTGSRHRREGGSGDCDDKIVIIASVFFLSPEHTSVRPSAFGGETAAPRPERAAFFRGKPPLRKIISGDTYRFFSAGSVASSGGTEPCDRQRQQPTMWRTRRRGAPLPRGTHFAAAARSFIIQLRGRNFFRNET